MASYGICNPAGRHHGGGAALALAKLGASERAREIASAEHEQAQAFGAAGTEGRALWVLARLDRDPAGLQAAADLLGRAGALGARAGVLADLGDALLEQRCAQPARRAYHEAARPRRSWRRRAPRGTIARGAAPRWRSSKAGARPRNPRPDPGRAQNSGSGGARTDQRRRGRSTVRLGQDR